MNNLKPWYLSKTVWGGLVAVAASMAHLAGLTIGPEDQELLAAALAETVATAGGLLAIYGRIAATSKLV